MKQNIGIWIDTKKAVVIKLCNNTTSINTIPSNVETRERIEGETKKYGRFGGQYLTYEKNKLNRKNEQINHFLKNLMKEIYHCDGVVIFGPAKMKKLFEKEIKRNMQFSGKLLGVHNSELLTDNQMIAWVKNYYKG